VSVEAVGFVPAAPLLVPAVAAGSAEADADLRAACRTVVRDLVAAVGDGEIVVVGPAAASGGADATWDFLGFGVPRADRGPRAVLPWPLGIGAWLLDDAGWNGPRSYLGVASPEAAAWRPSTGAQALLLVGDGTNCRTEKAPGYFDARAEGFDQQVVHCLAAGDLAGLAELDPELADELGSAGAAVWRWLGAAVGPVDITKAVLLADAAPYGVGYFAALWSVG
jgi:hypothetical protein